MSADGDTVREALNLVRGSSNEKWSRVSALAALARLEAAAESEHEFARKLMFENADEWTGAINKALNEANTSLTERLIAAEAQRDALAGAAKKAMRELGVPTDDYPAPVANAYEILRAALAEAGLE